MQLLPGKVFSHGQSQSLVGVSSRTIAKACKAASSAWLRGAAVFGRRGFLRCAPAVQLLGLLGSLESLVAAGCGLGASQQPGMARGWASCSVLAIAATFDPGGAMASTIVSVSGMCAVSSMTLEVRSPRRSSSLPGSLGKHLQCACCVALPRFGCRSGLIAVIAIGLQEAGSAEER